MYKGFSLLSYQIADRSKGLVFHFALISGKLFIWCYATSFRIKVVLTICNFFRTKNQLFNFYAKTKGF